MLLEVEALARTHTETALNALVRVCTDTDAPAAAQVSAAVALLDRGWGRAKQTVVLEHPEKAMTDEQLRELISSRLSELNLDESPAGPSDPEGGSGTPPASGSPQHGGMVH